MTTVMVQPIAWRADRSYKQKHSANTDSKQRTLSGKFWNSRKTVNKSEMSLLKFLAINALELSAPASPALLQGQGKGSPNWLQLSGHPSSIGPSAPGAVCKRLSEPHEADAYRTLDHDLLAARLAPTYLGEKDIGGEKYIELQDLLHGFKDPHVIDIKMGFRTFLESEVRNTDARPDLYRKMIEVDPHAPTEAEHASGAITKLRYMMFREQLSSSQSKGFRIEALKIRGSQPITDLKRIKTHSEVLNTISLFLGEKKNTTSLLLDRLRQMRDLIEDSTFFRTHEVIGSSVFIVYDDCKVGAWIIDFAKARPLPVGIQVDHRSPWTPGNYEEGILYGLDQLIDIVDEVKTSQSSLLSKNFSSRAVTLAS